MIKWPKVTLTGASSILWNGFPIRERIVRLGNDWQRIWKIRRVIVNILNHLDGWSQGGYQVVVKGDSWDCRKTSKEAKHLRGGGVFLRHETWILNWRWYSQYRKTDRGVSQMDDFVQCDETFSESWQLSRTRVCKLDILEILGVKSPCSTSCGKHIVKYHLIEILECHKKLIDILQRW